jgi:hypothetical protein
MPLEAGKVYGFLSGCRRTPSGTDYTMKAPPGRRPTEETSMKYMLLMMAPAGGWQNDFARLPAEDIRAHVAFMMKVNADLTSAGELVDAQGLAFPDQAKIVRAQDGGKPAVTDGP